MSNFTPRTKLPDTRQSLTHEVMIGGVKVFINVGFYDDGNPAELFLTVDHAGSTLGGMLDSYAIAISYCLQYGVPLDALVPKFTGVCFAPNGPTNDKDIREATSIPDYVLRWMAKWFPMKTLPIDPTDQPTIS